MQLDARPLHSLLMKHVRKKENMQQVFVSKTTKSHESYKICLLFSSMTLAQNITHATSRVHVFRVATSQKQLFRACICSSISCYTDPVNLPQLFVGMLDFITQYFFLSQFHIAEFSNFFPSGRIIQKSCMLQH